MTQGKKTPSVYARKHITRLHNLEAWKKGLKKYTEEEQLDMLIQLKEDLLVLVTDAEVVSYDKSNDEKVKVNKVNTFY